MNDEMIGKIVPVQLFGIEQRGFKENRLYVEGSTDNATFSINLLYENTVDPADGTHRFALLPDNPAYIQITKMVKEAGIELGDYPLTSLSEAFHDMYGAWVLKDVSANPLCRVYTENMVRLNPQTKKPEVIHKAGEPVHKKNPKTKEDLPELAIMTVVPVWGFCRKNPSGNWIWLKGNDPEERIQREINQGRLIYVNQWLEEHGLLKKEEKPVEEAKEEVKTGEDGGQELKSQIVGDVSEIGGVG